MVAALSAGCRRQAVVVAGPADSLQLVHAVELQQSDSNYVARPFRMSIRADGSIMISDLGRAVVWWYAPGGTLRRVIGRLGEGPGEFMNPGAIVVLGDSAIAVHEYHRFMLKILRIPDGRELRTVRMDAIVPAGGVVSHDTVWFGAMSIRRGTGVGVIAGVGSLIRWPTTDSVATVQWSAPDGLAIHGAVSPLGGLASQVITVDSTGFWVKYGLRNVLERRARDGTLLGEWPIPVLHRRGVPRARIDFALKPSNRFSAEFENPNWTDLNFSSDRAFGQRRDGTLMLITMDGRVEGKVLLGNYYASILDPMHNRACVDWVLPNSSVAIPLTTVVGDSVAMLSQDLDSSATTRVRLMLRYYTLPAAACHWQPMLQAPVGGGT